MATIETMLADLEHIANNPHEQLKAHLDAGKRVIGVGPYYVPEELVYAAGAIVAPILFASETPESTTVPKVAARRAGESSLPDEVIIAHPAPATVRCAVGGRCPPYAIGLRY